MKVSIIVPVYNSEKYLNKCIDSLLAQTLEDYEIILVNDGSRDCSGEILDSYKEKYPERIKVVHKSNEGPWFARIKGIEEADGDYITFCDSDDDVEPEMYADLYHTIKENNADLAVSSFKRIEEKTGKILSVEMKRFGNKTYTVKEMGGQVSLINAALWNKMFRREIIKHHLNLNEPPKMMEDMIFFTSILFHVNIISFSNRAFYNYYTKDNSTVTEVSSNEIEKIERSLIELRNKFNQEDKFYLEILSLMVFIHFGISVPLRAGGGKYRETKKIEKQTRVFLNKEFPMWLNNRYLTIKYLYHSKYSMIAPYITKMTYVFHIFSLFICVYQMMIKIIHIDIKW